MVHPRKRKNAPSRKRKNAPPLRKGRGPKKVPRPADMANYCMYHGAYTMTDRAKNPIEQPTGPAQSHGLKCAKCDRFGCYHCVTLFIEEIQKKDKTLASYLEHNNQWYQDVLLLKQLQGKLPEGHRHIGSCCAFKLMLSSPNVEDDENNDEDDEDDDEDDDDEDEDDDDEEDDQRQIRRRRNPGAHPLGGFLHVKEPNLLLRPSFGPHITVHGFATHKVGKNTVQGLLHGVTDQQIVVLPPPGSNRHEIRTELIEDTNIELHYENPFDKVMSSVIANIVLFKSKKCDDGRDHLGRYPTPDDIKHALHVDDTPPEGSNAKLRIILATSTTNKHLHLVSVAFKNIRNLDNYKLRRNREYFKACFDKCHPRKYECIRGNVGGGYKMD